MQTSDARFRGPTAKLAELPFAAKAAGLFAAVATAYVAGYKLASNWFSAEDQGASFFPPAGVTLATLVLVPRRFWPIVLAAAATSEIALDTSAGTSLVASCGYALANTAEPLLGALLVTALAPGLDLRRTRDLTVFIVCAVIVAPVLGGSIAATTFVYVEDHSGWGRFALEWWSGDGLGVLVVGGALLSLCCIPRLPLRRWVEGAALAAVAVACAVIVFELGWFELVYLPVALLIVLAFRVGTTAVALTSAVVAFVAASETAEAQDFWAALDISPANRILYLQLALGVVIAAVLALAAEIAGRDQMAVTLARTESERAAAVERARLFEAERAARGRAELLEQHASGVARAETAEEVARATIAVLKALGIAAGWVQLVRGDELESVESFGVPPDSLADGPYRIDAATPTAEAARTGRLFVTGTAAELDDRYPGTSSGRLALGYESITSVPLLAADGRTLGVLTLAAREPNWLDEGRSSLVTGLAEQCGLALERAAFRAQAEAAAKDAELLATMGEVLERASGARARARALVTVLSEDVTPLAVVHVLGEGGVPQILARAHTDGVHVEDAVLDRVAHDALTLDGHVRSPAGALELFSVPLRARGHALGVLTIGVARTATRITPVLVQRIATRAAIALDNALLYEQERDVSHALQMGLLGGELQPSPGTATATAYRPATASLEVGGDWYDAFTLADGRLVIVVGDVVGHGLEAAVAMGQLRGAVRALAPTGSPREVLAQLDRLVETLPEAAMATIAYGELDTSTGRLTYACAGHPPPLLVPAGAEPSFLWEGRSPPLGSSLAGGREEGRARLGPNDTIVLYTDGLVERRTYGISTGLDLLLRVAGDASSGSPQELVEQLLGAVLEHAAQEDDVCVLAVRLLPTEGRFVHEFPAAPAEVAGMRRRLSAWLEQHDFDGERRRDAILAAAEAAANAAEHAYGFDGAGLVIVEAWLSEGELHLRVRDEGRWREPAAGTDRGRGRTIMQALMRTVTIEPGRRGTVVQMSIPAAGDH